jgi:Putative DNA-binding domain
MYLNELQNLLYQRITNLDTTKESLGAERLPASGVFEALVHGDERLSAAERIGIYADAYFYRLLECLVEDFPATLAVLGADNFAALVKEYLLEHPPTEPSILYAGLYLADFLNDHPFAERWPIIADLARLERTVLDVFHATNAPALSLETLHAVPSEEWPALKLRTHPAVEIVHSEWRIADVLHTVEQGREWTDPKHEEASVLVWRQNALVNYRNLEPAERDALVIVAKGASFAAVCEAVAAGAEELNRVALIGRLMARWLADGIIMAADAMLVTRVRDGFPSGGS